MATDIDWIERKLEDIKDKLRGQSLTPDERARLTKLVNDVELNIKCAGSTSPGYHSLSGNYIGSDWLDWTAPYDTPQKQYEDTSCKHPKKYLNKFSPTFSFWYCPDCKEEVK
jgi:hypothetical protein